MDPWERVVEIPEGKVGTYSIEHFTRPAGPVERSNGRTAFIGGQNDPPVVFDRETRWHRLSYEGGTWMTDLPIEQCQHDQELAPVLERGGSVLIGGLGLGYAVNVLAACEIVDRIVVVERSPEVVDLVAKHVKDPRGIVEVITEDLFGYVARNAVTDDQDGGEEFDFAFYDIWQSDSEGTFHDMVIPLRQQSTEWVNEVICWNENVMRGQLLMGLQTRAMITSMAMSMPGVQGGELTVDVLATPRGDRFWDWAVPFWEAVRDGIVPNLPDPEFVRRAGEFAGTYGHKGWEFWWSRVKAGRA